MSVIVTHLGRCRCCCISLGLGEQTDTDTPAALKSVFSPKPNDVKAVRASACTCNPYEWSVRNEGEVCNTGKDTEGRLTHTKSM